MPRDVANPLVVLLLAQLVLFVGVGAVIPVIPIYGKSFGLSSAVNGAVIGAPAIALLLLARPSGGFADRAGRLPAMKIGMSIIVLSDLLTASATELPALVLARLGLGAGRCISECGERGYLADLASRAPEYRGEIVAAQQAVVALGIAIGSPLGGLAVESFGPRAAFLCVSAAALATLGIYALLPETKPQLATAGAPALPAAPAVPAAPAAMASAESDGDTEGSAAAWSLLLQDGRWRGLAACEVGLRVGFAAKVTSVPLIAAATLPGGALAAGSLLSAAALTGLVGAPLGGWLSDRRGARFVAVAAGALSGGSFLLVPLALSADLETWLGPSAHGLAFGACVLVWSFGVAALSPALTSVAQELAPEGAEATALALPRAAGDGAYIVAPFALGLLADQRPDVMGIECGVAGVVGLASALGLALLARSGPESAAAASVRAARRE